MGLGTVNITCEERKIFPALQLQNHFSVKQDDTKAKINLTPRAAAHQMFCCSFSHLFRSSFEVILMQYIITGIKRSVVMVLQDYVCLGEYEIY